MPAPRSSQQRSAARSRRKPSGAGIGPLFFIMAAIVLAVIVTAVIIGGRSDSDAPKAGDQPQVIVQSVKVKPYWETHPAPPPWNGLEVGTSREQVLKLFGKPNLETSTPHGYERLEFHDDPSRAGIFSGSGGRMLTVFIDKKTEKVLYFIAPGTVIRTDP